MQSQALDALTERAMADANGYPSLATPDLMPSPSDSLEAAEVPALPCVFIHGC